MDPELCPTCGSDDPLTCCGLDDPHLHGSHDQKCCPDPFHTPVPTGDWPKRDLLWDAAEKRAAAERVEAEKLIGSLIERLTKAEQRADEAEAALSTVGLPADLLAVLRDQSIVIPKDATVFDLIASWQNAPSNTASAGSSDG